MFKFFGSLETLPIHLFAEVSCATCYFRHLREIFSRARIEVTNVNKREIDEAIREIVGVKHEDCSVTGKEVKKRIAENEGSFVSESKEKWSKHSWNSVSYAQPRRYIPKGLEQEAEAMLSRVIFQVRSMKLKNWKARTKCTNTTVFGEK